MNRLQSELQRLYQPRLRAGPGNDAVASTLVDPHGLVRAMVLELARPADWELLASVWRGVQSDLELPAPAIAVSGTDGFSLWFSLEEPVAVDRADAFLRALCSRYLPEVAPGRLRLIPAVATPTTPALLEAAPVPALQTRNGCWSAFVSADLAPIFADTPWLESAPSDDGQAGVLKQLASITQSAFEMALERLGLSASPDADESSTRMEPSDPTPAQPAASPKSLNPKLFLLQVMNDERVPLALRVEAAKALLPYLEDQVNGTGQVKT